MAYADRDRTGELVTGGIVSGILILALAYALITGLAYSSVTQMIKRVTTVDVKEEAKKPPPPPPPPKNAPPPIVAPLAPINVSVAPPVVQTVQAPPPPAPVYVAPAAPPAVSHARGATPKNQSDWASRIQDNYPSDALRANKEGRVGMSVTVGPDGKVSACTVVSSSGTPSLDSAACSGMEKYARYNPPLDDAGNPTSGSMHQTIVYKIPEEE